MKGFERFVKKVDTLGNADQKKGAMMRKSPLLTGRPLTAEYQACGDAVGIAIDLLKEITAAHGAVCSDPKCDPNILHISRALPALCDDGRGEHWTR